jgi:hypothetical protein
MVQEEGRLYNSGGGDLGSGGGEASESSVSSSGGVGEQGRDGRGISLGEGDLSAPDGDMGREQPVTGGGEIGRKRQASSGLMMAAAAAVAVLERSCSKPQDGGGKFTTEFRLGGMSKLRMRAISDSGVGDSGRSEPPSTLMDAAAAGRLGPLEGGGDAQRKGSGEVGRDMDDLINS